MDEPIEHVRVSPERARALRRMTVEERLRLGADLSDTAAYFAKRGGKRQWSPRA